MGLVLDTVSHQVVFSQSYDPGQDRYSESFSAALIEVPQNTFLVIRNFLNQAFYFRSSTALDTPVTLMIASIDDQPGARFLSHSFEGADIQIAPGTPLLSAFTGNPDELIVAPGSRNRGFPFRFAYRLADAANYSDWSAYGLINSLEEIHEPLMIQGTTYGAALNLPFYSRGRYLLIMPYLASLKQTEIYASTRVRFTIEVDAEAYNHNVPEFLAGGA